MGIKLAHIGIIVSLCILSYGFYNIVIGTYNDNFWLNLGYNLVGLLIVWAWLPILIACVVWLWIDREWNSDDAKWNKNVRRIGGPSWGNDW